MTKATQIALARVAINFVWLMILFIVSGALTNLFPPEDQHGFADRPSWGMGWFVLSISIVIFVAVFLVQFLDQLK